MDLSKANIVRTVKLLKHSYSVNRKEMFSSAPNAIIPYSSI